MKKEISANHQSWIVEDFTACELGRCFNCSTPKLHFHCSLPASARWVWLGWRWKKKAAV